MKTSYGAIAATNGGDRRDESTPLLEQRRREAAWALTVSLLLAALVGAAMLTLAYALTTNATSVEDRVKARLGGWTIFGKSAATTTADAVLSNATAPYSRT